MRRRLTPLQRLLCELIAVPSVNPALLPEGHAWAGEGFVAEFVACLGASAGLDVDMKPVTGGRPNVFARLTPAGRVRQRVLLAPHLDTVGAEGAAFRPRRKKNRIYGRGACDTKGSVAVMLHALTDMAQLSDRPRHTEVVFAGLVDEEVAQAGSRALVKSGFKADLAIVGEATRAQVVTAHKGNLWLKVTTRGKAAHGSRPELGVNAILHMARVVELLEGSYATGLKTRRHPLLGHPTVNVGAIRGGQQPNIVPEECELRVDRRTLPGEDGSSVVREMGQFIRNAGLTAEVTSEKLAPCDPLCTRPELPLVRSLMRACSQRAPKPVDYFCDAAILSAGGIPSVVFGPGDIAQAHTADEWVGLDSLDLAFRRLSAFLRGLP